MKRIILAALVGVMVGQATPVAGQFEMSDFGTERILRDVRKLPKDTQRGMAIAVVEAIVHSIKEIKKTPGQSSPERGEAMKTQLKDATKRRHLALKQGAVDFSDPAWATAALIEGWLMANSGQLGGRVVFEREHGLITGWAQSVLSDTELKQLGWTD